MGVILKKHYKDSYCMSALKRIYITWKWKPILDDIDTYYAELQLCYDMQLDRPYMVTFDRHGKLINSLNCMGIVKGDRGDFKIEWLI